MVAIIRNNGYFKSRKCKMTLNICSEVTRREMSGKVLLIVSLVLSLQTIGLIYWALYYSWFLDLVQFYVSFHFIAIESNILKVNLWIRSVSKKYVQIDIILHTFLVLRKTCELRTSTSYLSKRIELNGTPVPNPIDFTTFYSRLSCCHQSVAKVTSLRLPKFHNVTMYLQDVFY